VECGRSGGWCCCAAAGAVQGSDGHLSGHVSVWGGRGKVGGESGSGMGCKGGGSGAAVLPLVLSKDLMVISLGT
jgi:hypothetical protein